MSRYAEHPDWLRSFEQTRLARRIYGRRPDRPCRFWFCATQAPWLVIEPLTEEGRKAYDSFSRKLADAAGDEDRAVEGGLKVNRRGRVMFFGPGLDESFLWELSRYVKANVARVPALAGLVDAMVASVEVDVRSDEALAAVSPKSLTPYENAAIWEGVLAPSIAGTAELVASRRPGERSWFWLGPVRQEQYPVLLIEPLETDPNTDRLHRLVDIAAQDRGDGALGVVTPTDDGTLQFVSDDLEAQHLSSLAFWVKEHVAEHPGLARLAGCELVRTRAGRVEAVFADETVWDGVPRRAAPGTLAETAERLEAAQPGQDHWFWLCDGDEPFLAVAPVDSDPDGEDFGEQRRIYRRRFPRARVLSGVVRRLSSGALAFSAREPVNGWDAVVQSLSQSLPPLQGARLVQLDSGVVVGATAIGTQR